MVSGLVDHPLSDCPIPSRSFVSSLSILSKLTPHKSLISKSGTNNVSRSLSCSIFDFLWPPFQNQLANQNEHIFRYGEIVSFRVFSSLSDFTANISYHARYTYWWAYVWVWDELKDWWGVLDALLAPLSVRLHSVGQCLCLRPFSNAHSVISIEVEQLHLWWVKRCSRVKPAPHMQECPIEVLPC